MSAIEKGPITLTRGDITEQETDAIVNPSNTGLVLGGGVSGAIRMKGGPTIQAEMDRIGRCEVGSAVVTRGGDLKARYVIHAVGPKRGEEDGDAKLASATREALRRAGELGLESIALPAISTGIFGYPMERAADIMLRTAMDYFESGEPKSLKKAVFCLWSDDAYDIFARTLENLSG